MSCYTTELACVKIYLPCFINIAQYEEDILLTFSFIDSIFEQFFNAYTKPVIIGDFNFDEENLCSERLNCVVGIYKEYNKILRDRLDNNKVGYTFKQKSFGLFSFIDHLYIQERLL